MRRKIFDSGKAIRRAAVGLVALAALVFPAPVAYAGAPSEHGTSVIELPGATSAEGIAEGEGNTFFAGDLAKGDIFRGDVGKERARLFIDVPDGRMAVGMKADVRHDLLFVAGGATGQAYVYSTDTRKTVATYQLIAVSDQEPAFINDVTLTREGAWFTNSLRGELYFVPVDDDGDPGDVRTLALTGPAAGTPGAFNLNGIAAVDGGKTLIVAHSANSALYTVDPETGASAAITGAELPLVDGIVVKGNTLWAVQNMLNQISRVRLDRGLESFDVKDVITSRDFKVPTTAALFGDTLAVVNAKFGVTGASTFEVVLVDAR
jgi:sugar lactone lactonase YvrE